MRILLVNDYRSGGGAEVVVDDTAELLGGRGHEVRRFVGEDIDGRRTPWSYVANRRATAALRAAIDEFQPDAVHFHNVYHLLSPSVLAARRTGPSSASQPPRPRWVLTAHDFHLVCPNSGLCWFDRGGGRHLADPDRLGFAAYLLGRRWDHRSGGHGAMKLAQHFWGHRLRRHRERLDLVLCPGEAAAATLRRAGLRTPVAVLPNPFDADAVRATARAAGGPPPRWPADDAGSGSPPIRLVFVGRVEREKGLATVLEAWPAVGDAELLVVGGGGDLQRCRRIAADRGIAHRVRFAGPRPRPAALAAIAAADAMLLPSRTPEVAPMVLFEALALGTRVIAPAFGAMREILAVTGEAHAIDPMDPDTLPGALSAAIVACGRRSDPRATGTLAGPAIESFLAARHPERHVAALETIYTGTSPEA